MTPGPAMNLLWSYWYARTLNLNEFLGGLPVPRIRFFADSGAHSARTLGVTISVDEYAGWLTRWRHWMTIYANLDVIGAPQGTWDNQKRLEEVHGLHPMPVYHTGEHPSALERYLEAGYSYIAFGKLLGNPASRLRPWLARAFRLVDGRAAIHGLGMTQWKLLCEFPWYSVDSSTWGAGVRFGQLRLFHQGRWTTLRLRCRADVLANRAVLDAYAIPYAALSGDHYDRDVVAGACAQAVYRAAAWIRQRRGAVLLPPGKGYPPPGATTAPKAVPAGADGLHTYLAEGGTSGHQRHAGGLHLYLADSSEQWTRRGAAGIAKEGTA